MEKVSNAGKGYFCQFQNKNQPSVYEIAVGSVLFPEHVKHEKSKEGNQGWDKNFSSLHSNHTHKHIVCMYECTNREKVEIDRDSDARDGKRDLEADGKDSGRTSIAGNRGGGEVVRWAITRVCAR